MLQTSLSMVIYVEKKIFVLTYSCIKTINTFVQVDIAFFDRLHLQYIKIRRWNIIANETTRDQTRQKLTIIDYHNCLQQWVKRIPHSISFWYVMLLAQSNIAIILIYQQLNTLLKPLSKFIYIKSPTDPWTCIPTVAD